MVVILHELSDSAEQAQQLPGTIVDHFVALQVLDILTTLLGLQMGAQEGSMFLDA